MLTHEPLAARAEVGPEVADLIAQMPLLDLRHFVRHATPDEIPVAAEGVKTEHRRDAEEGQVRHLDHRLDDGLLHLIGRVAALAAGADVQLGQAVAVLANLLDSVGVGLALAVEGERRELRADELDARLERGERGVLGKVARARVEAEALDDRPLGDEDVGKVRSRTANRVRLQGKRAAELPAPRHGVVVGEADVREELWLKA